ncbi:MAG: class I tRNA ligase family protein [Minicystis sp.]
MCVDLGSPRCTICGSAPRVVTTRRLYFPMARFEAALRSYVARTKMSAHLGVLCDQMLDARLPEICVTHISSWGLPVPLPGYEDQRLYSWFEMAAGYLAATRELAARGGPHHDLSNVWADPESEIVQFFGFDNGYFHALLFPALFLAYDPEINLPRAFVVNEFYLLDGSKFSTSRNHAVWGREFLAEHPADHMRFFLSMTSPEVERTNFRLEAFRSAVTSELGRWRRWLEELASRVRTGFDMRAPEPGPFGPVEEALYGRVCALVAEAAAAYEARSFSPQRATHALCELVRSAQRFGADASHWLRAPTRRDEARTAVSLELAAARALAIAAGPIMPEFSARLWRLLGYPPGEHPVAWEDAPSFVPVGQPIGALGEALAV